MRLPASLTLPSDCQRNLRQQRPNHEDVLSNRRKFRRGRPQTAVRTRRSHFDESCQRRLKLRRLLKSISRKVGRPFSNRSRPTPWGCRWPGSNRRTSIFRHPDTRTGDMPVRHHRSTGTGIRNSGSSLCTGIHKSALDTPSLSTVFGFIFCVL